MAFTLSFQRKNSPPQLQPFSFLRRHHGVRGGGELGGLTCVAGISLCDTCVSSPHPPTDTPVSVGPCPPATLTRSHSGKARPHSCPLASDAARSPAQPSPLRPQHLQHVLPGLARVKAQTGTRTGNSPLRGPPVATSELSRCSPHPCHCIFESSKNLIKSGAVLTPAQVEIRGPGGLARLAWAFNAICYCRPWRACPPSLS